MSNRGTFGTAMHVEHSPATLKRIRKAIRRREQRWSRLSGPVRTSELTQHALDKLEGRETGGRGVGTLTPDSGQA